MAARKHILKICALGLAAALIGSPSQAQFATGGGRIEQSMRAASGLVNDGFSAFHLMLAGLDRRDLGDAMKQRLFSADDFRNALKFYEEAAINANNSPIADGQTARESEAISSLRKTAQRYGLNDKFTSRDLIVAARGAVDKFAAAIDEENLAEDMRDARGVRDLALQGRELESFLLDVATALAQPGG